MIGSIKRAARSSVREAVLEAGIAVLAVNPGASMSDIAQSAGVGRASLHRHFASRDTLLKEVAIRALDGVIEVIQGVLDLEDVTPAQRLATLIERLVPVGDLLHFIAYEWKTLFAPELVDKYVWQEKAIVGMINDARNAGSLVPGLSGRWLYYLIDSVVYTAWYAIQDGTVARRDAPELAKSALIGGIFDSEREPV